MLGHLMTFLNKAGDLETVFLLKIEFFQGYAVLKGFC